MVQDHHPGIDGPVAAQYLGPDLLTQIDVASRFISNSEFYLHEAAEHQEDGLRRAITGHGIPRSIASRTTSAAAGPCRSPRLDYIIDEYRELVDGYGNNLGDEEDMP